MMRCDSASLICLKDGLLKLSWILLATSYMMVLFTTCICLGYGGDRGGKLGFIPSRPKRNVGSVQQRNDAGFH